MSNPSTSPNDQDGDLIDMGEPIAVLAGFDSDASTNLAARIRRTIHRRATTVQLLSFSWTAPGLVLKEFWFMLIEQADRKNERKDGGHEGETS